MQSAEEIYKRNIARNTIFFGALGMAIAFLAVLFVPKQHLVVGKIVVFPSGPGSAEKNLSHEIGNTIEIINTLSFRNDTFQGASSMFSGAVQSGNSSTITLSFFTEKKDLASIEDAIVRVPTALSAYSRDLYNGSPFKYRMLGDPEISLNPVKPDILQFLVSGFLAGAIVYMLYWILFDFLRVPSDRKIAAEVEAEKSEIREESAEDKSDILEDSNSETPSFSRIGAGSIELVDGRPNFKPGEISTDDEPLVPDNLPVSESDTPPMPQSEEPTDEEVKERLNRLMRGDI